MWIIRLATRGVTRPLALMAALIVIVAVCMAGPAPTAGFARTLAVHHAAIMAAVRDALAVALTALGAGILLVLRGRVAAHEGLHSPDQAQSQASRSWRQAPPPYRQTAWREAHGYPPASGSGSDEEDPVAVLNGTLRAPREPGKDEL